MDRKSIEEKVKQIIADHLGIDEDEVKTESKLVDDLGADSLDEVELAMYFEDEFDIEIPDEDMVDIKTVDQVIDYLSKAIE